jgi:rubredoxin
MSDENEKIILGGQKNEGGQNNMQQPQGSQDSEKAKELAQQHNIPEQFVDTEFQVPTETVELPSEGRFYPNGKSKVEIKYMTAEEDDILFSPDLIKSGRVLDALLDVVVVDRDLRPENMLSGDRNYVLIETRKTGFGDDYQPGEMSCKSCNYEYSPIVDLSKLSKKSLPENISPDENGEFSVEMPMMKVEVKFRFLNGHDEKRLAKIAERGQKKSGQFRISRMITEKYLLQIMEVNGNRDKSYIKKYISAMPTRDSYFFRDYVRKIEPGIDLSYEFECPACGNIEIKDVPITPKLFYPDMED